MVCQLFFLIIGFIVGIIDAMVLGYVYEAGPFELISYVIIIIPAIAVTARRLHDINLSGWWQLIVLTIVGIPIYLYWLIIKVLMVIMILDLILLRVSMPSFI